MSGNSSFIIRLENLGFYSYIGVGQQEQEVGNEFSVDCEIEVSADKFVSEELDTTVSYAEVYALIDEIMKLKWRLLESATKAIAERIFEKWPEVGQVSVKITKRTPPISGIQGSCSVEYRNRVSENR